MTKTEILDAINSTIITNGQKGITADSLRNILTEMTNAAGEGGSGGSGDGILRIMVPLEMKDGFANLDDKTVSAANWEAYKENIRASIDLQDTLAAVEKLFTLLDPVYEAMFVHNAEVYQTLLAKTKAEESTIVLLDASAETSAFFCWLGEIEELRICYGQAGLVTGVYVVDNGEEGGEITIQPIKTHWNGDHAPFEEGWFITLNPDGSLTLADMRPKLYLPETNDVTLTDDQMAVNADLYNMVSNGFKDMASVTTYGVSADRPQELVNISPMGWSYTSSSLAIRYLIGNELRLYTITFDGTTTVTVEGTIPSAS